MGTKLKRDNVKKGTGRNKHSTTENGSRLDRDFLENGSEKLQKSCRKGQKDKMDKMDIKTSQK